MTAATLLCGDVMAVLPTLPADHFQCVVTSPPYWGLRDYGITPSIWGGDVACAHEWNGTERRGGGPQEGKSSAFCSSCGAWCGALGLEPTPALYLVHMVLVFREIRRVLRKDGTLWVNMGDCYVDGGRGDDVGSTLEGTRHNQVESRKVGVRESFRRDRRPREDDPHKQAPRLKPKDLLMMPARLAIALQDDGWWLRADIIWAKPNPMPESVTDRPTKAHEYLFLLARSKRYHYDAAAIAEPLAESTYRRLSQPSFDSQEGGEKDGQANANRSHRKALKNLKAKHKPVAGGDVGPGGHSVVDHNTPRPSGNLARKFGEDHIPGASHVGRGFPWTDKSGVRNARSVWTIPTQPYAEAHFATFPGELARRCILAGSRPGDAVLDPFGGSGTVAGVAIGLGRASTYIDLSPAYLELARRRIGPLLVVGA